VIIHYEQPLSTYWQLLRSQKKERERFILMNYFVSCWKYALSKMAVANEFLATVIQEALFL